MRRQLSIRNGPLISSSRVYSYKIAPIVRRQPQRSLNTTRCLQPQPRGSIESSFASRQRLLQSRTLFSSSKLASIPDRPLERPPETKHIRDLGELVKAVTNLRERIDELPEDEIALEGAVVGSLSGLETTAGSVVDAASLPPAPTTSTLLDLDDERDTRPTFPPKHAPKGPSIRGPYRDAINLISDTAYRLIAHPNVFISPQILEKYVRVQCRLGLPESLGYVFELYANKPMPRRSGRGIKYVKQNPDSYKNAIPKPLVDMALDTAIAARNLDAAVAIIQSSFDTNAFRRAKIFRRAFLPAAAVVLAPIAIYDISSSVAAFQNTMDQSMATFVFFTGIMAYVGFTGSLGVIARMSANDHVKRVSWALGIPLRYRWLHEEQRAAYDKVACSWGFVEPSRFGEETGEEWASLREYLGQKGMVLDSVELMEGMQ